MSVDLSSLAVAVSSGAGAVESVHNAGGRVRSKLSDSKNNGIYVCTR